MYLEVYLDVLFAVNFFMDFLLLYLTGKMLGTRFCWWRYLLAGVLGAAGVCFLVIWPVGGVIQGILLHGILCNGMVWIAFSITSIKRHLWAVILFYGNGFFIGGFCLFIRRYLSGPKIGLLFLTALAGCAFIQYASKKHKRERQKMICRFKLCLGKQCVSGWGFVDTGNSLHDTITGKPVSIGQGKLLGELLSEDMREELMEFWEGRSGGEYAAMLHLHFLPFISLGCKQGMMLAVTFDTLYLDAEKIHQVIHHPVIGFTRETFPFEGDYQMILHPNLIDSQEEFI